MMLLHAWLKMSFCNGLKHQEKKSSEALILVNKLWDTSSAQDIWISSKHHQSQLIKLYKVKLSLWEGRLFVFPAWSFSNQDIMSHPNPDTSLAHSQEHPFLNVSAREDSE